MKFARTKHIPKNNLRYAVVRFLPSVIALLILLAPTPTHAASGLYSNLYQVNRFIDELYCKVGTLLGHPCSLYGVTMVVPDPLVSIPIYEPLPIPSVPEPVPVKPVAIVPGGMLTSKVVRNTYITNPTTFIQATPTIVADGGWVTKEFFDRQINLVYDQMGESISDLRDDLEDSQNIEDLEASGDVVFSSLNTPGVVHTDSDGKLSTSLVSLSDLLTQGTATDEYCLTSESSGGAELAWQPCTAGGISNGDYGDITVAGGTWTIDNGAVTDIKVSAGIDAIKLANGSVSNTEFQYLDGVTSSLQTQLDAKGTYTLPTLTAGSVIFSNGTILTQDNSNFFWDDGADRLGIGTGSPGTALHIVAPTNQGVLIGVGDGGVTPYPSWMGTNGLYVDGQIRGGGFLVGDTSGLSWGIGTTYMTGIGNGSSADYWNVVTNSAIRLFIDGNGKVGISGVSSPDAKFHIGTTAFSSASTFGTSGFGIREDAATYTSTTSSGTITTTGVNTFAPPILAASSATTLTNAATVYIADKPTAGTNVTITNGYGLYIASGGMYVNAGAAGFNGGLNTGSGSNSNFLSSGDGNLSQGLTNALSLFAGASAVSYRTIFNGSGSGTILSANSYGNVIVGSAPVTTFSSGTHAALANLVVNPIGTVTSGGATVTKTASLLINGAGSGGTNNYALLVNSAGTNTTVFSIDGTGAVVAANGITATTGGVSSNNGSFSGNMAITNQLLVGTNNPTARTYRTTNGGSDITPLTIFGLTANTAGFINLEFDPTNGLVFSAANGTRQVARGGIQITNLVNTAGSESGDLIFLTQAGGTAMSEKARLSSTGNFGLGVTPDALFHIGGTTFSSASNYSTSGFGIRQDAATYTSTTSSGTVAATGVDTIAQSTLAASSATTLTNASTLYIAGAPIAGTNVTISSGQALNVAAGLASFNGGISTSTGTLNGNASFYATGAGGLSSTTNSIAQFAGSSTINYRIGSAGTSGTLATGVPYANVIVAASPITTFSSGTHALLANIVVNPIGTVTNGGATVTKTASLFINGAGSGGTNNYALDIVGNGTNTSKFTVDNVGAVTSGAITSAGDILPSASYTYSLGSASKVWNAAVIGIMFTEQFRSFTSNGFNFADQAGTSIGRFFDATGDFLLQKGGTATDNLSIFQVNGDSTASSGTYNIQTIGGTIAQTSTAGYNALLISPFQSSNGSGNNYLINAGTNSAANAAGTHTPLFIVTSGGRVATGDRITIGSIAGGFPSTLFIGTTTLSTSATFSTSGFGIRQDAATYTSTTSSGTIATSGVNTIAQPTLAASGATTLSDVATLYIANKPAAGTNVTISRGYALMVGTGFSGFGGGITTAVNTTAGNGNFLTNGGVSMGQTTLSDLLFASASTVDYRTSFYGSGTTAMSTGDSYGAVIVGKAPVTTFSSGTHALLANLVVNPIGTVSSGGATVTNTASIYVDGAGTGGTSNFSVLVNSGLSAFNGGISTNGNSGSSNLFIASGAGVGSTTLSTVLFAGATTVYNRAIIGNGTFGTLAINSSYGGVIVGSNSFTTAGSGTHALLANVVINPLGTVTNPGATVTKTATLYVNGASSAGTSNYAINSTGEVSLTSAATGGYSLYNTSDESTNYERGRIYWGSNLLNITTEKGGTGTNRPIQLSANGAFFVVGSGLSTLGGANYMGWTGGNANMTIFGLIPTFTASSGVQYVENILPTVNQTSTAGYKALWISPYEQATGSGVKYLIDAGTNSAGSGGGTHTQKFTVSSTGAGYFSGTLGVGMSATNILDVAGDIGLVATGGTSRNLKFYSNSVWRTTVYNSGSDDSLRFASGGSGGTPTDRMTIDSTGRVGIGTTAPASALDTRLTANNTGTIQTFGNITSGVFGTIGFEFGTGNPLEIFAGGGSDLVLGPNVNVQGLRLQSGGNVAIGTETTPDYLLDVENTGVDTNIFALHDSDGECLHNPEAGSESVTCSSDERLKTDIRESASVLVYFNDFKIHDYKVIASGDQMSGVIAQEVLTTHPELVTQNPDGFYSVQLPNQWKIVKAIQELDFNIQNMTHLVEGDDSLVSNLRNWFADTANGIQDFFATRVHTDEICVKKSDGSEVCVTGDQLDAAVNGAQAPHYPLEDADPDDPIIPTDPETDPAPSDETPVDDTSTDQTPGDETDDNTSTPENSDDAGDDTSSTEQGSPDAPSDTDGGEAPQQ